MSRNSGGNIECVVSCEFNNCESYTACFFLWCFTIRINRLTSHRHYSSSTCSNCNFTCFSIEHFPIFSLSHVVHILTDRSSETSRGVPTFLCPFHVRSSPPRDHLRKPTINSSGGSCDAYWITDTERENFLGVQMRSARVQPVISDPHAASRCSSQAAGHPAHRRGNPIMPVYWQNPVSGSFSPWFSYYSFFFFFCYLCRRITVTNIKPNASRYARWSAAGIKLVEPFKRMTVEIFQGEGGGRLRRNRAALWGFTVNLKRI